MCGMERKMKYVLLILAIMLFILSFFPELSGGVLNYVLMIGVIIATIINLKK